MCLSAGHVPAVSAVEAELFNETVAVSAVEAELFNDTVANPWNVSF